MFGGSSAPLTGVQIVSVGNEMPEDTINRNCSERSRTNFESWWKLANRLRVYDQSINAHLFRVKRKEKMNCPFVCVVFEEFVFYFIEEKKNERNGKRVCDDQKKEL
jgi:hypothetical protein